MGEEVSLDRPCDRSFRLFERVLMLTVCTMGSFHCSARFFKKFFRMYARGGLQPSFWTAQPEKPRLKTDLIQTADGKMPKKSVKAFFESVPANFGLLAEHIAAPMTAAPDDRQPRRTAQRTTGRTNQTAQPQTVTAAQAPNA